MSTGRANVAALFLFNHRFERNLEKLDAIYGDRFPRRKYLMPFARSDRPDVLRVRETSWNFSGHIAQTADRFMEDGVTHYVVISDDLIVNPRLKADNIVDALGLSDNQAYIKSLASIDALRYTWWRALQATIAFRRHSPGFDWRAELPDANDAQAKFVAMGVPMPKPSIGSLTEIKNLPALIDAVGYLSAPWAARLYGQRSEYPLLGGYSDFFVVPAAAMEKFAHYCGVFAALDIFAEIAVPTALALAADDVRTELAYGEGFNCGQMKRNPDFPYRGVEFWAPEEAPAFADRFDRRQDRLFADFPKDWLYVHPVKLSQWT